MEKSVKTTTYAQRGTIYARQGETTKQHYQRLIADGFSERFAANISGWHSTITLHEALKLRSGTVKNIRRMLGLIALFVAAAVLHRIITGRLS